MTSLDKFLVQLYRRFNTNMTEIKLVTVKTTIKYINTLTEPDKIYFESVMLRHHPTLFSSKKDLVKCVTTKYYSWLIDKCNENIILFDGLVRRLA